jgi:flagellar motor switch/type III secretory pathway protein FliN
MLDEQPQSENHVVEADASAGQTDSCLGTAPTASTLAVPGPATTCEEMGTGPEPACESLGDTASGEVPVPVLPQALTAPPHSAATLDSLPLYTRSLLKIKVPVVVTLAQKRQTLRRVLELAPGAIIQFDKSCGEMLQLAVGHRPLAQGEAVKVGDKFGICVSSIILPEERFKPVLPPATRIG